MMSSSAFALSAFKVGSARRLAEISANGSGLLAPGTNADASKPDQARSNARPSTPGRRPCDMRVNVAALTPDCSDTSFQFKPLASLCASSAA